MSLTVDPRYEAGGDANDDVDSAYVSTVDSTDSLNSSILRYRQINGRTFQNMRDADYHNPNDEQQQDTYDITHHMMSLAMDGKLYFAPLENPEKALDIGTGTGIWAMDFADEFPSCQVVGTDLSPIQPSWVPPNLSFELDNCEEVWTYAENSFDYIHIRGLLGSVADWPKLYGQCLRCLTPGGWLEHSDYSLDFIAHESTPMPEDSVWRQWSKALNEAGVKMGMSFDVTTNMEADMRKAGFTGAMEEKTIMLPIGTWPKDQKWKEVGLANYIHIDKGAEGYLMYACTQVLGWRPEEVDVLVAMVRKAMKPKKEDRAREIHVMYPSKNVWAQKPLGKGKSSA